MLPPFQDLPFIDTDGTNLMYASMNGILTLVNTYEQVYGENSWGKLDDRSKRPLTINYRKKVVEWMKSNPEQQLPIEMDQSFAWEVVGMKCQVN